MTDDSCATAALHREHLRRMLVGGLCDDAWHGRWEPTNDLNTRPRAEDAVEAVLRVMDRCGLEVVARA